MRHNKKYPTKPSKADYNLIIYLKPLQRCKACYTGKLFRIKLLFFSRIHHLQTRQTPQQDNICNDKPGQASALPERFEL